MKLSLKLSVLFIFSFLNSNAQEGFRIGPTGAFFFSKPTVLDTLPDEFNFRYKGGFGGGISMYYGFTKNFGVSLNGTYVSKGYRVFNDTNFYGTELKRNQSLIEVPLYVVFKQRFNSTSFVRETVGASVSFLLSKQTKEISNDNGSYRIYEETKNTIYPMLDFGVEVGNENKVGHVFIFGFHYKHSFTNYTNLGIYNNKTSTTPYFNLGFKGSYLGVSLTYQFNLKSFKREEEFFY